MRIRIVTLFPEIVEVPLRASILGRAAREGLLQVSVHQLRKYATDRHRTVDDAPYGGGAGMVLKPEPLAAAIEALRQEAARDEPGDVPRVIVMSPQGRLLNSDLVQELALERSLIIVCGHYGGVDERVIEMMVDDEVSVGDYVLTGGELPALVLIDAVARFVPGVLGALDSALGDSFSPDAGGLLQGPVYTRPAVFRGRRVPEDLVSGDHARVDRWRREQAARRTRERRPDLWERRAQPPSQ